jgi:hypothetical protein
MKLVSRKCFGKNAAGRRLESKRTEPIAFSNEVDTGSREENASKQKALVWWFRSSL